MDDAVVYSHEQNRLFAACPLLFLETCQMMEVS